MILLVDNYDSFTFNLYQYLGELGADVKVVRNDALSVEEALALRPERIVISPGPGTPDEAGISLELILRSPVPLLGVCLGHQALGLAFGARLVRSAPVHGKTAAVRFAASRLLPGITGEATVMRYHSLALADVTAFAGEPGPELSDALAREPVLVADLLERLAGVAALLDEIETFLYVAERALLRELLAHLILDLVERTLLALFDLDRAHDNRRETPIDDLGDLVAR